MYSQSFPHQFCWTLHSRHVHCNIHIFDNRHKLKTGTISIEDLSDSIRLQILRMFPSLGREHLLWDSAPQCPHHLARPCQSSTCEKKNTIYIYHIIYLISYERNKYNLYISYHISYIIWKKLFMRAQRCSILGLVKRRGNVQVCSKVLFGTINLST